MIRHEDKAATFVFEDRQSDRKKGGDGIHGLGSEITQGVVFGHGDIFLFGKEVDKQQPRFFWLRTGDIAADAPGAKKNFIQDMIGYCLEGYEKYPNPDNRLPGSFFSPIGIKRIPSGAITNIVRERSTSEGRSQGQPDFPPWSTAWVDVVYGALFENAEVLSNLDLPSGHRILKHFGRHSFVDSNED
jgi:hypothetical protein